MELQEKRQVGSGIGKGLSSIITITECETPNTPRYSQDQNQLIAHGSERPPKEGARNCRRAEK